MAEFHRLRHEGKEGKEERNSALGCYHLLSALSMNSSLTFGGDVACFQKPVCIFWGVSSVSAKLKTCVLVAEQNKVDQDCNPTYRE